MKPDQQSEMYTRRIPGVDNGTLANPSWGVSPSRYQVAKDVLQTQRLMEVPLEAKSKAAEKHKLTSIIGTDDRFQCFYEDISTNGPNRWTCHITTTVGTDAVVGTGAFIAPRLVLTAAHVVRPTGTAPDRIRVIPGAGFWERGNRIYFPYGEQESTTSRIHPRYVHSDAHRTGFDLGVVVLPDDSLYQKISGRYGVISPSEALLRRMRPNVEPFGSFNTQGYPGDKPAYTMWGIAFGHVLSSDALTINTDADIWPGQSGSPCYIGGDIFGVVSAETTSVNIIKRIDDESFAQIQAWMDEFK